MRAQLSLEEHDYPAVLEDTLRVLKIDSKNAMATLLRTTDILSPLISFPSFPSFPSFLSFTIFHLFRFPFLFLPYFSIFVSISPLYFPLLILIVVRFFVDISLRITRFLYRAHRHLSLSYFRWPCSSGKWRIRRRNEVIFGMSQTR